MERNGMQKKSVRNYFIAGALLVLFIVFTVLIKTVDVRPIGTSLTEVGFAGLNDRAFRLFGVHPAFYTVTEWLGVIAIAVAAAFAVLGVAQLVRRKSLKRVDAEILLLGALYVAVALCYLFFEIVVVNYRPIFVEGALEASYPSSHTMLSVCVLSAAVMEFQRLLQNKPLRIASQTAAVLLIGITVIGRLLSGAHWLTDILGGLLLSASLLAFYYAARKHVQSVKAAIEKLPPDIAEAEAKSKTEINAEIDAGAKKETPAEAGTSAAETGASEKESDTSLTDTNVSPTKTKMPAREAQSPSDQESVLSDEP